jgi:hypothetical protein
MKNCIVKKIDATISGNLPVLTDKLYDITFNWTSYGNKPCVLPAGTYKVVINNTSSEATNFALRDSNDTTIYSWQNNHQGNTIASGATVTEDITITQDAAYARFVKGNVKVYSYIIFPEQ